MSYNKNPENIEDNLARVTIPNGWRRLRSSERVRENDRFMLRGEFGDGAGIKWADTSNVGKQVKTTGVYGPYIRRKPAKKRKARK